MSNHSAYEERAVADLASQINQGGFSSQYEIIHRRTAKEQARLAANFEEMLQHVTPEERAELRGVGPLQVIDDADETLAAALEPIAAAVLGCITSGPQDIKWELVYNEQHWRRFRVPGGDGAWAVSLKNPNLGDDQTDIPAEPFEPGGRFNLAYVMLTIGRISELNSVILLFDRKPACFLGEETWDDGFVEMSISRSGQVRFGGFGGMYGRSIDERAGINNRFRSYCENFTVDQLFETDNDRRDLIDWLPRLAAYFEGITYAFSLDA